MALHHDERVITGLLYLWIRDGRLPLTEETCEYIKEHYLFYLGNGELHFGSGEIVDFIEANHFVQHIVRRLRQLTPRKSRYQAYSVPGGPEAHVVALDNR